MGKMLTVKETAARLGLAPPTVYGLIDEGTLPGYKLGRSVRVDEDELEAWKESRRVRPEPKPVPVKRPPGRPKGGTKEKRDPRWVDVPVELTYTGLKCLSRFQNEKRA